MIQRTGFTSEATQNYLDQFVPKEVEIESPIGYTTI